MRMRDVGGGDAGRVLGTLGRGRVYRSGGRDGRTSTWRFAFSSWGLKGGCEWEVGDVIRVNVVGVYVIDQETVLVPDSNRSSQQHDFKIKDAFHEKRVDSNNNMS